MREKGCWRRHEGEGVLEEVHEGKAVLEEIHEGGHV